MMTCALVLSRVISEKTKRDQLYNDLSISINRLIKNKADLNMMTTFSGKNEKRLLLYVAEHGFCDLVERMVNAGANINVKDLALPKDTVLHIAVREMMWQSETIMLRNKQMIDLLLTYGADRNIKNGNGETSIDIAYRVNKDIAEYIINFKRNGELFAIEDFTYYFMPELTNKSTHEMSNSVTLEPFALHRCPALAALKNS